MSHWSQENAKLILDRLCEHPSVTAAGKLLGIPKGSKTIWTWARDSARDKANGITDSKYIITGWPDDAEEATRPMYFFEALELSRKIWTLNLHADTCETLNGLERPVIEGGKFQHVIDLKAIAEWDNKEDAEKIGGYVDWPYAHDAEGARIVLTVKEHVPAQLKIQGLKALLGEIWNVPEKREIDSQVTGGVLVLHGNAEPAPGNKLGMREDLESRLAEIRARNAKLAPATKKPEGEVEVFRDMRTQDQPDDVPDRAPKQLPPPAQTIKDHPRAYEVEKLTPAEPKPEPKSYARPASSLDNSFGGGRLREKPPGGFRVR